MDGAWRAGCRVGARWVGGACRAKVAGQVGGWEDGRCRFGREVARRWAGKSARRFVACWAHCR